MKSFMSDVMKGLGEGIAKGLIEKLPMIPKSDVAVLKRQPNEFNIFDKLAYYQLTGIWVKKKVLKK